MTEPVRCAACRRPIPAARLAAVPDALWCVRCAERHGDRVTAVTVTTHRFSPKPGTPHRVPEETSVTTTIMARPQPSVDVYSATASTCLALDAAT